MKPDLREYLGREVEVEIDRPLGSTHPRWPDIRYPVNYGFVPGTISSDGDPIDAYMLGLEAPAQRAQGVVIALVVREDDAEDKLVVASAGKSFSMNEVRALIEFQEQYFNSSLVIWEPDE